MFLGFVEIIEENDEKTRGIIRFTNGIAYYYTTNGTAEIEINNDGTIKIIMVYNRNFSMFNRVQVPFNIQFPAKLVLEF
jgi:hypothetical protein